MSKTTITDRALELLSQAGDSMKHVGPGASKLMQTGVALGAMRTGSKLAIGLVRRNPVMAVAAAVGVGVMAYAAKRKRDQEAGAPLEGRSKRVEAKRVTGTTKRSTGPSKAAARKPRARRAPAASTSE